MLVAILTALLLSTIKLAPEHSHDATFVIAHPTSHRLVGTTTYIQHTLKQSDLDPYPGKPKVTFKEDGTFKITVFSDLHFGENPWDSWGPQQDVNSMSLMRTVLADESPDYVVINGDLITGENTFKENATSLINEIMGPINDAKVKFSSTHGNHDNQANITHLEEIQRELQISPLSYTRTAPSGIGGEEGPGNYWVPVYAKESGKEFFLPIEYSPHVNQDSSPSLVIWFFDSRGGVSSGPNSTALPDWVDNSVATWIESETSTMEDAWGSPSSRAALAFVHIPPYAIQAVQPKINSTSNPGLNADTLGSGSTQASSSPSSLGNDQPFWDSLNANVKNLHAVISGHDHGDEWCAREPTKNVIFCFDKHSGYGRYSSTGWGHGVRNIVLSSADPTASLDTWIRLEDGTIRAHVTLDKNYS